MAGFTLSAIALALAAGGTAASAVGQYKAGQNQKKAGAAAADVSESQAQVADYNAHVADLQATDAIERGDQAEARFRTQIRGAIGAQRTGFAAGNIDVGFGSAVDVQADAAFLGELDALTIKTNAAREAWGYQVQAYDYRQQAKIDRKAGANQILAGESAADAAKWNVASTIVGGTTSLLEARYGFNGKGRG
jgi:hypothetical protein